VAPYPSSTRQFARLLVVLRSHISCGLRSDQASSARFAT
jgi:hypothetical protein